MHLKDIVAYHIMERFLFNREIRLDVGALNEIDMDTFVHEKEDILRYVY